MQTLELMNKLNKGSLKIHLILFNYLLNIEKQKNGRLKMKKSLKRYQVLISVWLLRSIVTELGLIHQLLQKDSLKVVFSWFILSMLLEMTLIYTKELQRKLIKCGSCQLVLWLRRDKVKLMISQERKNTKKRSYIARKELTALIRLMKLVYRIYLVRMMRMTMKAIGREVHQLRSKWSNSI